MSRALIRRIVNLLRTKKVKSLVNSLGNNCSIGKGFSIKSGECITIGENFYSGRDLYLQAWTIYRGEKIGLTPSIKIGNDVSFMDDCQVSCMNKIVIGNGVLFGNNVFITDNFHGKNSKEELSVPPLNRKLYSRGPVIIGNNVWIGRNVCIMPGVKIGDGAVIGANAVVTHDIPSACIAAGVPAKIIK